MRHLVLVGLMGAGKSTVGRVCAERLGRSLVDTDDLVEVLAGASVEEIFGRDGEARFRELEQQAVAKASAATEPTVIACGGGAVLDAGNRRRLRETGFVVWLRAPAPVLRDRVGNGEGRPLLAASRLETLERLVEQRSDAYKAAAHAEVDTEGIDCDAVAEAVLAVATTGGVE